MSIGTGRWRSRMINKMEKALEDLRWLYSYYFTDEYAEHGWCPTLDFRSIEDVIEKILKATITILEFLTEKTESDTTSKRSAQEFIKKVVLGEKRKEKNGKEKKKESS